MALNPVRLASRDSADRGTRTPRPLGRYLLEQGSITSEQLVQGLQMQLTMAAPLGEIAVAEGWTTPAEIDRALCAQHGMRRADLRREWPDAELCARLPAEFWLRNSAIALRRDHGRVAIATARPEAFEDLRPQLTDICGPVTPVYAPKREIESTISSLFGSALAGNAETRVPRQMSFRSLDRMLRIAPALLVVFLVALALLLPAFGMILISGFAFLFMALFVALRATAFVGYLRRRTPATRPSRVLGARQLRCKVSVLVPLFREREIAGRLVERLKHLTYPKALLDVILVLEEGDRVTRRALDQCELPNWMRIVEVPAISGLKTKPRAMNYALNFCTGDIVGVWDAEDAPDCSQIEKVVERFSLAGDDVVCLQGVLDYYNPRHNWLTRCFTVEYAAWFRVLMTGIAQLRLVVPLGGTTLFFRRDKLIELGGWDAHNVTEDADLGVRLARRGWRTEMIDTVTYEEATCRVWPWIRQRSRWLKGFLVTYLVHMRDPPALWRDLGPRGFWGMQAFFVGTVGQFLLAPALWSLWALFLALPHPLFGAVPLGLLYALAVICVLVELFSMLVAVIALRKAGRTYLIPFVPSMLLYYPLGTLAAFKAFWELTVAPVYWDKTAHGQSAPDIQVTGD